MVLKSFILMICVSLYFFFSDRCLNIWNSSTIEVYPGVVFLIPLTYFCSRCGQMLHVLMTVCVADAASSAIRLYNSLRQHSMPKCGSEV